MRLQVEHETHYQYASPVLLSQQLLHLSPRALPWQACEAHDLAIEPAPGERDARADFFGNPVTQILIAAPHPELRVLARTTVHVAPREREALARPRAPWEAARDAARGEAAAFIHESPHVETSRELAQFVAPSFPAGRAALEGAIDLAHRIYAGFEFDRKATSVSTPLREVMKKRRGVCQDFAHLMIGALRALGLGARYVSGYLLTEPPPGRARLVGADASHAWVSVYCGAAGGWVDIDPTNDCVVDDEHVTLGWGRDFGDVTPMRGVILGGGEQALAVRVTVTPLAG
jgi:transglutaminase-like putative cysteine protease